MSLFCTLNLYRLFDKLLTEQSCIHDNVFPFLTRKYVANYCVKTEYIDTITLNINVEA